MLPRAAWKHADGCGGFDRVIEAGTVGVEVEVVAGDRAAGEDQLGHRRQRRDADHLRGDAGPDRIERAQPGEKLGVLRAGDRPRQALVHVVVGIDEARQGDATGQRDDFVGGWRQRAGRANGFDDAIADENAAVGDFPAFGIHGDEDVGVLQQQCRHWPQGRKGLPGEAGRLFCRTRRSREMITSTTIVAT